MVVDLAVEATERLVQVVGTVVGAGAEVALEASVVGTGVGAGAEAGVALVASAVGSGVGVALEAYVVDTGVGAGAEVALVASVVGIGVEVASVGLAFVAAGSVHLFVVVEVVPIQRVVAASESESDVTYFQKRWVPYIL